MKRKNGPFHRSPCPALSRGVPAVCTGCRWLPGGPGPHCVGLVERRNDPMAAADYLRAIMYYAKERG